MCLKEIVIKQIIGIFEKKGLRFNLISGKGCIIQRKKSCIPIILKLFLSKKKVVECTFLIQVQMKP